VDVDDCVLRNHCFHDVIHLSLVRMFLGTVWFDFLSIVRAAQLDVRGPPTIPASIIQSTAFLIAASGE
jgi:hypothetical protein